jgi:predicted alpha/beta-fold hydrolase
LWGHFLKSPELENLGQSFTVDLPDGDRLSCFYQEGDSPYVISLFHGLSGDVTADYMQRTALLCRELGHTVVLVNHRGAGEGSPGARYPYHCGRVDDVSEVLKILRKKFPNKKQISVGYSMSGNILLCLLGGYGGEEKPDAGITVNAPLNLQRGAVLLKTGFNRIYDVRFVHRLRKSIEEKYRNGLIDQRFDIPFYSSVYEMDEIYTAPSSGFSNRDDYYAQCSSVNYVQNITIPTYMLTAADDPFVSIDDYMKARFSKSTQLHIEQRGGHLGYLAGANTPLGSKRWLDYYLSEAINSLTSQGL